MSDSKRDTKLFLKLNGRVADKVGCKFAWGSWFELKDSLHGDHPDINVIENVTEDNVQEIEDLTVGYITKMRELLK